ncbi:OLC1v1018286C1 [Oldenlandia corymbosa var. corymbosa]|uniref:OLC1v1018286C1 n=1 Tax=Oldenlandia corymbosa var. corymbosa TaxID=529605 RepID=A0AAV1EB99_OLDCO|nr:OLC1v1018286C1 [Oldenlandia corymbosa var. corymbosa]
MAEAPLLLRPLMQWQRLRHLCFSGETLYHHLSFTSFQSPFGYSSNTTGLVHRKILLANSASPNYYQQYRGLHLRTRALKLRDVPLRSNSSSSDSDSDGDDASSSDGAVRKSRNEKKRDAKRAVRWGMELANLTPSQIKLILRVTSLKPEVYEALMLVKRLSRDVREGRRRQFNYIGKLLREVNPELMDDLIQATKVGDTEKLRNLCGSQTQAVESDGGTLEETEDEYEEEESETCISVASRWLDGLISKDIEVTNEIYSLNHVDFDRQELRRLVRKVHILQERQESLESEEKVREVNANVFGAKRSLTRFLQRVAKQIPAE